MHRDPFSSYAFHRHWHYRGGPHRLIWFLLGAGTATLFIKHREAHKLHQYYGHCFRAPVTAPAVAETAATPTLTPEGPSSPNHANSNWSWNPRDIPRAMNNIPPASSSWGYPENHIDRQWEEEKKRLLEFGKQAEDTVRLFCVLFFILY